MNSKLSIVINAQNSEGDLENCLNSVKNLADEIVVIDQESTDSTVSIAKKFNCKIFTHEKVKFVEMARNFGISKASGDWILVLDPDEQVSATLAIKIKELVKSNEADYYYISRKNIIFNKWMKYSRWWPDYNLRLFKKGCVSWFQKIHVEPSATGTEAKIEDREEWAIIHNHYVSISQFLERMNRYTDAQVITKVSEGYKFEWKDLIRFPMNEFLSRYFYGEGYKDGLHGLALAALQAFSELVLYLKIWEKQGFEDSNPRLDQIISEANKAEKDLHFWQNDALYKTTGNVAARIKRKLRI
jgi:(heptosyl)LPS beta-1,4-glucosyltransferase